MESIPDRSLVHVVDLEVGSSLFLEVSDHWYMVLLVGSSQVTSFVTVVFGYIEVPCERYAPNIYRYIRT